MRTRNRICGAEGSLGHDKSKLRNGALFWLAEPASWKHHQHPPAGGCRLPGSAFTGREKEKSCVGFRGLGKASRERVGGWVYAFAGAKFRKFGRFGGISCGVSIARGFDA